jgi:hypothetical protein
MQTFGPILFKLTVDINEAHWASSAFSLIQGKHIHSLISLQISHHICQP